MAEEDYWQQPLLQEKLIRTFMSKKIHKNKSCKTYKKNKLLLIGNFVSPQEAQTLRKMLFDLLLPPLVSKPDLPTP